MKLTETIEKIVNMKEPPIDLNKVAVEWYKKIGGPAGLAERLEQEYVSSKVGGLTRTRLLEMLLRLTGKAFLDKSVADLSLITEKDLQGIAMELLSKVTKRGEKISEEEAKPAGRSDTGGEAGTSSSRPPF